MRTSSERGSAPVEFLLLGVPMVLTVMVFAQVMLVGHQRELLQDAAIEAASFGALADQSATAAIEKSNELVQRAVVEVEVTDGNPKMLKVTLRQQSLVELQAVGYAVFEAQ